LEFRQERLHQKTRILVLLRSDVGMILRLAILVEPRLVTDRRNYRDWQIQGHSVVGKNTARFVTFNNGYKW